VKDTATSCVLRRFILRPVPVEVPQSSTQTGMGNEVDEPDDTIHDPNWLPRTQTKGQSDDDSHQPPDQPRYNIRSSDKRTPEVETAVEQPETDASVNEPLVQAPVTSTNRNRRTGTGTPVSLFIATFTR
jgi:hypothetical protein